MACFTPSTSRSLSRFRSENLLPLLPHVTNLPHAKRTAKVRTTFRKRCFIDKTCPQKLRPCWPETGRGVPTVRCQPPPPCDFWQGLGRDSCIGCLPSGPGLGVERAHCFVYTNLSQAPWLEAWRGTPSFVCLPILGPLLPQSGALLRRACGLPSCLMPSPVFSPVLWPTD